jgi:p-hydroxybenzoate 3-monooxygenase
MTQATMIAVPLTSEHRPRPSRGVDRVAVAVGAAIGSPLYTTKPVRNQQQEEGVAEERSSCTQVGIVGAGPAGLVLARLLDLQGIDSVVLEARDREYVEKRVRAGVLEQGTVELLIEMGVGDRMVSQGLVHHGIYLRFDRRDHHIAFDELTDGGGITIYGQQEVVKDLIAARLEADSPLHFEVDDVRLADLDSGRPRILYRHEGGQRELRCDFVAGCDGFHGVCRDSVPEGALRFLTREYPFAWFGVLAEAPPSTEELIYCSSERGFALHSMRSPQLSRLYFQCDPGEDLDDWPDERIWEELHTRLAREDDWSLTEGPFVEKGITPMRSFVSEPMQYGRLYLAGDAAHIVPPTGAKGLNLAVADVRVLAEGLVSWFEDGDESLLQRYTETCLRRVWRTQHFSWWMTWMLHRFPDDEDGFQTRLSRAQLEYVCSSETAAKTLAENYVGLRFVGSAV